MLILRTEKLIPLFRELANSKLPGREMSMFKLRKETEHIALTHS